MLLIMMKKIDGPLGEVVNRLPLILFHASGRWWVNETMGR
jgi:hypothetical protein